MRQSADAAVLLVANLNIRGVGNGDVNAIRYQFSLLLEMICFTFSFAVSYGTTVSACREDACATFFTFAHELGHNFGATHGYHHHHHFLHFFLNVSNVSRLGQTIRFHIPIKLTKTLNLFFLAKGFRIKSMCQLLSKVSSF